jgi:hypothetical protein
MVDDKTKAEMRAWAKAVIEQLEFVDPPDFGSNPLLSLDELDLRVIEDFVKYAKVPEDSITPDQYCKYYRDGFRLTVENELDEYKARVFSEIDTK